MGPFAHRLEVLLIVDNLQDRRTPGPRGDQKVHLPGISANRRDQKVDLSDFHDSGDEARQRPNVFSSRGGRPTPARGTSADSTANPGQHQRPSQEGDSPRTSTEASQEGDAPTPQPRHLRRGTHPHLNQGAPEGDEPTPQQRKSTSPGGGRTHTSTRVLPARGGGPARTSTQDSMARSELTGSQAKGLVDLLHVLLHALIGHRVHSVVHPFHFSHLELVLLDASVWPNQCHASGRGPPNPRARSPILARRPLPRGREGIRHRATVWRMHQTAGMRFANGACVCRARASVFPTSWPGPTPGPPQYAVRAASLRTPIANAVRRFRGASAQTRRTSPTPVSGALHRSAKEAIPPPRPRAAAPRHVRRGLARRERSSPARSPLRSAVGPPQSRERTTFKLRSPFAKP